MTPLVLNNLPKEAINQKVKKVLDWVKLGDRKRSLPKHLSGGEQQRVTNVRSS